MVRAHEKLFRNSGMDFVMGTARFVGERTVEVAVDDGGTRTIRGRDVVVDTGTTPAMPDTTGLAEADPWTSESILRLERLPESVIVLGGGYVGCEFASMLAVFGTRVTLLQRPGRLLPYTVFTTPELARIGLSETQARAEGRAITVAHLDVSAIPRAKTLPRRSATGRLSS